MDNHSEVMTVECAENCGNSPKKQLLKELTIAFAKNEKDFWLSWLTEDVVWEIIGEKRIQGKAEVEKAWHEMKEDGVRQLTIHNIITHGNTGSVNGIIHLKNQRVFAICDIYNFSGFGKKAKIKQITSYVIETT